MLNLFLLLHTILLLPFDRSESMKTSTERICRSQVYMPRFQLLYYINKMRQLILLYWVISPQYQYLFLIIDQKRLVMKNIREQKRSTISNPEKLFAFIKRSDNKLFVSNFLFFRQQILTIVDENESTLLHAAVNYENFQIIQFLFQQYQVLSGQKPELFTATLKKKWVNQFDSEGFTPLHYAVFRNNFNILLLLQRNGADVTILNEKGLCGLHIAAQANSPLFIFYFLSQGIQIQSQDQVGNTPLHWACYKGMEHSVATLISLGANFNKKQRKFGMTPLHMATISGNGRIVKKLLIRGCDRSIKTNDGKTAHDIAQQNCHEGIKEMIQDKFVLRRAMNCKSPFRKPNKYSTQFYLFFAFFLSCYILNVVTFSLCDSNTIQRILYIVFYVLGALCLITYSLCFFSDPGFEKESKTSEQMFQITKSYPPHLICFDCSRVKSQRSRHCQVCGSCVAVYDHHCPWISNCIGCKNVLKFFVFLIFLLFFILTAISLEIINLVFPAKELQLWQKYLSLSTEGYTLIIALIFVFPISKLIWIQASNGVKNRTTFELYLDSTKKNEFYKLDDISLLTTNTNSVKSSQHSTKLVKTSLVILNRKLEYLISRQFVSWQD